MRDDSFLRPPALPRLLFGEKDAQVVGGFYGMTDKFSHLTPDCDYDSKARRDFVHKGSYIDVNGVAINETYYCHMIAVSSVGKNNILLPVVGLHNGIWRNSRMVATKDQGFFIPRNDRFELETEVEGVAGGLIISFDLDRLERVGMIMSGGQPFQIDTRAVRVLPLTCGKVDFKKLFLNLMLQIDAFATDVDLLVMNGFDEQFYRLLAMTFKPELFLKKELTEKDAQLFGKPRSLLLFERYVEANIEKLILLSEVEALLGVTARTLQYACLRHYGCSPRVYIRNKKLELAFERLQTAKGQIRIARLAAELGFSSQSQFSRFFRERFGILPSQV